jgi:tight adherence protein B
MIPLVIALLVFLVFVTLIVGLWWASIPRKQMRERLAASTGSTLISDEWDMQVTKRASSLGRLDVMRRLGELVSQAGYTWTAQRAAGVIAGFALMGGLLGVARVGGLFWALAGAVLLGSVPVIFLMYKRSKRLQLFQSQFPDAMDMMTRAIRAGHALGGAIRLVGEEMPGPIGPEFQRVSEEIRLGLDPGAALAGLEERMPSDDVRFFCTAVSIQRMSGGNLAEILDRLSEVIRERFKLLSHARALSAQHKWSAILVGLSPVGFALLLQVLNPGYFDVFLASPQAPSWLAMGLLSESIGFFLIWRISKLQV